MLIHHEEDSTLKNIIFLCLKKLLPILLLMDGIFFIKLFSLKIHDVLFFVYEEKLCLFILRHKLYQLLVILRDKLLQKHLLQHILIF